MTSGRVSDEQVVVALEVVRRESAKRSPRKSASLELVALDHRAHGAVEDEDALGRDGAQLLERTMSGMRSSDVHSCLLGARAVTTLKVRGVALLAAGDAAQLSHASRPDLLQHLACSAAGVKPAWTCCVRGGDVSRLRARSSVTTTSVAARRAARAPPRRAPRAGVSA